MDKIKNREELIKKINTIDDQYLIDEIYRLLQINFDDSIYQLNEEQQNYINEARKEIKNGKAVSSKHVDGEIDEWLNK